MGGLGQSVHPCRARASFVIVHVFRVFEGQTCPTGVTVTAHLSFPWPHEVRVPNYARGAASTAPALKPSQCLILSRHKFTPCRHLVAAAVLCLSFRSRGRCPLQGDAV